VSLTFHPVYRTGYRGDGGQWGRPRRWPRPGWLLGGRLAILRAWRRAL